MFEKHQHQMKTDEFLEKLNIELKISKNSPYTIKNYTRMNKLFLDFTKKEPEQISEDDIKKYLAENFSEKSATSTILFLAAIKYAYLNILKKDITNSIKRPKKEKKIPIVMTTDEVKSLLDACVTKKSKLILSLIYSAGLRVSEVVNLKTEDLNFEEKIGYIKQGKGRKDRIFNIPEFLTPLLKEQVENQQTLNKPHLFSGPNGKLTERNIQKIVSLASKKSNIKKNIHCHTLRHSFATHLIESGVDIRKIQELLGHADLSTTQIYTHISNQELKKIKSPLDTLFSENK